MFETIRLQVPLLLIVSGRSLNEPRQTSPKSPVLAIRVAMVAVPATPLTGMVADGVIGSLLDTVKVAVCEPLPVGVKVT